MKKIISLWLLIYSMSGVAVPVATVHKTSNEITVLQQKPDTLNNQGSNQSTIVPKNPALTDTNRQTTSTKTATQGISQQQVSTQNIGGNTIVNFSSPKGKPLFSLTPNTNGTYNVNDLITHNTIFTNVPARAINQLLLKNNILTPISTIGSTAGNTNSSNSTTVTSVQAGTTTSTNSCTPRPCATVICPCL